MSVVWVPGIDCGVVFAAREKLFILIWPLFREAGPGQRRCERGPGAVLREGAYRCRGHRESSSGGCQWECHLSLPGPGPGDHHASRPTVRRLLWEGTNSAVITPSTSYGAVGARCLFPAKETGAEWKVTCPRPGVASFEASLNARGEAVVARPALSCPFPPSSSSRHLSVGRY